MAQPLRIGILGAARIAESAIVKPAHATGARLVVVASRDRERAEAFAARHGVERATTSYADVLADPEVDLVYNPLPNGLHGPWNLRAVAAGKHVLSEKPFAATAAEAAEVRDAAQAAGVTVVEGFHYLFHPVMQRMLALVDSGEIGQLRRVETDLLIPAPPDGDLRWSFDLAGGAVMDVGCYGLHALRVLGRWAGGEPEVVAARARERAGAPGVDALAEADLRYPGGATGTVRCGMEHPTVALALSVEGTRGEARALSYVGPYLDDRIVVRTATGTRTEQLGTRSSYLFQLEALTRALRGGEPMPTGADDAVATAVLIDSWYRKAGLPLRARTVLGSDRTVKTPAIERVAQ